METDGNANGLISRKSAEEISQQEATKPESQQRNHSYSFFLSYAEANEEK